MAFIDRAGGERSMHCNVDRKQRLCRVCSLMSMWLLVVKGGPRCAPRPPRRGARQMPQQRQLAKQMVQSANIQGNYRVIILHCCHMETNWVSYVLFSLGDESVTHNQRALPSQTISCSRDVWNRSKATLQKICKVIDLGLVAILVWPVLHAQRDESLMLKRPLPDGQIIHASLKFCRSGRMEAAGCAVGLAAGPYLHQRHMGKIFTKHFNKKLFTFLCWKSIHTRKSTM